MKLSEIPIAAAGMLGYGVGKVYLMTANAVKPKAMTTLMTSVILLREIKDTLPTISKRVQVTVMREPTKDCEYYSKVYLGDYYIGILPYKGKRPIAKILYDHWRRGKKVDPKHWMLVGAGNKTQVYLQIDIEK